MNIVNRILLASSLVLTSGFMPAVAVDKTAIEYSTGPVTEPLGDTYDLSKNVPAPLTRMTFYRIDQGEWAGATGIEINGQYHTSLQPGSFSQLCLLAPTSVALSSRLIQTDQPVKNYVEATTQLKLRQAAGTLTEADLASINALLNP